MQRHRERYRPAGYQGQRQQGDVGGRRGNVQHLAGPYAGQESETDQTLDAAQSPVPAPAGSPAAAAPALLTTPFSCPPDHSTTVYTSGQLKKSLAAAEPGDVIG